MNQIEYVLNIDINKSINSLSAMRTELKAVSKAMNDAATAGDTKAYDKLSARFIDLRDQTEDLNAKLQPMDKQIQVLTRGIGSLANIGSGLATVFGADAKSAEALFKTFAKAQAVMQLVNGFNEMVDLLPKVGTALKAVGAALKAAFIANPIAMVVMGIAAVSAAIVSLIVYYDEADAAAIRWTNSASKGVKDLLKATEEYASFVEQWNKKVEDFNDRNLTAQEKELKVYTEKITKQAIALKNDINLAKQREDALAKAIKSEQQFLDMTTDPQATIDALDRIASLKKEQERWNTAITNGENKYNSLLSSVRTSVTTIVKGYKEINDAAADKKAADEEKKLLEEKRKEYQAHLALMIKYQEDTDKKVRENILNGITDEVEKKKVQAFMTFELSKKQALQELNISKQSVDEYLSNKTVQNSEEYKLIEKRMNAIKAAYELEMEEVGKSEKEIADERHRLITEALSTQEQIEVKAIEDKYAKVKEAALKLGGDNTQLLIDIETKKSEELLAIETNYYQEYVDANKEANDIIQKDNEDALKKRIDSLNAWYDASSNILGSISGIIGENTREAAIASRAAALFQIGVDTAKGISNAMVGATSAGAASGPAAPIVTPIVLAQMIAIVMSSVLQAKNLLSEPLPMAYGGIVPGSGNQDSVRTMLMPGEGVLTKAAIKNIGVDNLNRLNNNEPLLQRVFVTEYDISKTQKNSQRVNVRNSLKKLS